MAHLRDLVEDLRALVPVSIPGQSEALMSDPVYGQLHNLLRSAVDSPEMDALSAEEMRAFTTFRITVYRAGQMEPTTGRKHIGATWRGAAKQAVLKLAIGPETQRAVRELMSGGIG